METMDDKILLPLSINSAFRFICKNCDYKTSKKSSYDYHIISAKHKKITQNDTRGQHSAEILPQFSNNCDMSVCSCGKKYKYRQGLWKHKQNCNNNNDNAILLNNIDNTKKEQTTDKDQLIMMLIKENSDFKSMLIEQQSMMMKVIENGTTNNSNNTTNSHNKAFNLQFFLNETCKDAMNIADFIDSIKLQLSDLEKVGEVGYVEGISNIIIKNLNNLDETKRPVHCTDKKRETIYIKDEGQWEKEDDNNSRLKKSINKVANKNIKLISQFREKYPECKKCDSSISDKYNKMIIEAMGGLGDNKVEKEEKIIRNISKATIISSRNIK
jgi:hypothetical protein